jgi:hypothetical protein
MNREDTVAVPWMAGFRRNAIPAKVVWKQDDVHHSSFYWLAVPSEVAQTGGKIVASYHGSVVDIESTYTDTLSIRLNDAMMDLDKPVIVRLKGMEIFKGKVKRTAATIFKTVNEKMDPDLVFFVELPIKDGKIIQGSND